MDNNQKKTWLNLLDKKEKEYLGWLLLVFVMNVLSIMFLCSLNVKFILSDFHRQNLGIALAVSFFFIFAVLNAFGHEKYRFKKYPIWFWCAPLLTSAISTLIAVTYV